MKITELQGACGALEDDLDIWTFALCDALFLRLDVRPLAIMVILVRVVGLEVVGEHATRKRVLDLLRAAAKRDFELGQLRQAQKAQS